MENLNNLYNFKNPIRHFFNLNNIKFDGLEDLTVEDLCWTAPAKFKIFKTENSQRTISFSNILNFYHAIKCFQDESNFYAIKRMSRRKRVSPDLTIGEFSALSYYTAIQRDVFNLTKYDKLLIMDIKSFYGRIYTHDFGFNLTKERRITSLNRGRTNGLLLGSYLSLYLAETFLIKLEEKLSTQLQKQNIDCHYEYFSDDFYFFCNSTDIDKIKEIFSKVLDEYELQVNYDKTTIFDFEEYSKSNNLEKLWMKIIKQSEESDKRVRGLPKGGRLREMVAHYPVFFTQLVYRLSQISDLKYKRIFLANFFKTYYFNNIDPELFTLSDSDFNYICYIYKLMPETILYSIDKVKLMKDFNISKFKDFAFSRFKSTLQTEKFEEQIYFYYAIKICGFDAELNAFKEVVLQSKNQILISYFIMDGIIQKADYQAFLDNCKEEEWLQNYHYLLQHEKENIEILMPAAALKERQKNSYKSFYELNLRNNVAMLKSIEEVKRGIQSCIESKIESYKNLI